MWRSSLTACFLTLLSWSGFSRSAFAADLPDASNALRIVDCQASDQQPPMHLAYPVSVDGREFIGPAGLSLDAGRTWKPFKPTPDFATGLPYGYRRDPFPAVLDPATGKVVLVYNALDTPNLDPKIAEPPAALKNYYLRYRVSNDAGQTWLFDEPVIQDGHTEANPLEGVWKGKNAFFFGDVGCVPIFTSRKEILVPFQICPLGVDGELANPGGGHTFHEVAVLIGTWNANNRIDWTLRDRVAGDPKLTTRGLFEPTLAEFSDGRILMIMRGSNQAKKKRIQLPSYKWIITSSDGGRTWSIPKPWTYADGEPFFSPSSMSQLFRHSSGHVFWIGNISEKNAEGNSPRWPLVIGQVDPTTLGLIKSSVLQLDTRRPNDPARIDLSHFRAVEDFTTRQIVLTVPRALNQYKSISWTTYRLEAN